MLILDVSRWHFYPQMLILMKNKNFHEENIFVMGASSRVSRT